MGKVICLILTCIMIAGCATTSIPINYAPSSVKSATGALSVGEFKYLPSEPTAKKPIPSNLIKTTAFWRFEVDRDVKTFIRDAIFTELRFVGIKTNDSSKILSGDIEELLVDDIGFNVDWTLRIKYVLINSTTKEILYQSVKNTQRRTSKGLNTLGALNETVKINIEQLLEDADFIKAIQ